MAILAYIDPGSGSMILQVILAGVLAVPFLFRRTIGDFVRRVRVRGRRDSHEVDAGTERSQH